MSGPQRQLYFNAFLMSSGHHEAAWRLPGSNPFANTDLGHGRDLARIAKRATFDSLFLADGPAVRASPEYRPVSALEPTILLTALAAATSRNRPAGPPNPPLPGRTAVAASRRQVL
jgi:alkanesulfonate monooxygenase SsuD/methylene tetrahydromethanopterin reductase-like flavin-dependent oxidoreductase (luciferase family)